MGHVCVCVCVEMHESQSPYMYVQLRAERIFFKHVPLDCTGSCAGLRVLMEWYDLPIDFSTQCSQAAPPEASSAWTCVRIKTKINTVYSGKADRQMVEERVSRESKKSAY